MAARRRDSFHTRIDKKTKAIESIAESLERISAYLCAIEKGLAKSYQKPINVYMEVDDDAGRVD